MPPVASSSVHYTISLALLGREDVGACISCTIQGIELSDGRIVTVRFDHITDECRAVLKRMGAMAQ